MLKINFEITDIIMGWKFSLSFNSTDAYSQWVHANISAKPNYFSTTEAPGALSTVEFLHLSSLR